MSPIPAIETARLRLRAHVAADFEPSAAMWADPTVTRFIGGAPLTREAAWSRFLRHPGFWHHLGFGYFVVEDRATGAFLGEAGFQDLRRALNPSIEGTMEAGWVLARAAQGRGLAEEAMRAALAWADRERAGARVTCMIAPDHAASLRVAAKLGFVEQARALYAGRPVAVLERPHPFTGA